MRMDKGFKNRLIRRICGYKMVEMGKKLAIAREFIKSDESHPDIRVLQIACYHKLAQLPTLDFANTFF